MALSKYLRIGFAGIALLLLFQFLNITFWSLPIAESACRNYYHDDYSSRTMIGGNVELSGHYWDFAITKEILPGYKPGICRVHVSWIGTPTLRWFKGNAPKR